MVGIVHGIQQMNPADQLRIVFDKIAIIATVVIRY